VKSAQFGLSLLCFAVALLCGCAAGPSLRSIDTNDAKIIVTEQGDILVHGEKVPLYDLHEVIEDSDTEPDELIIVQLQADPSAPGMQNLMRAISREMTFAKHYKYSFSTPLKAYTQTFDKQTGKTEVYVSGREVQRLETIADKEAEVRRMQAEADAYERGSYVSDAAKQKPVETFKGRSDKSKKQQAEQERLRKQWKNRRR
jgi:hypothetical protein